MSRPQPIPRQHGFFIQQPIIDKLNKSLSAPKEGWPDGLVGLVVQIACHPALITAKSYRDEIDRYFNAKDFDVVLNALFLARKEVNKMLKTEDGKINKVGLIRAYLQSFQFGLLRDKVGAKLDRTVEPSAADIIEALGKWGYEVTKGDVRKARKELRQKLPQLREVLRQAEEEKRRRALLHANRDNKSVNRHA